MNIFEKIVNYLFRQKITKKELDKLHPAQKTPETWIFSLWDYKHPLMRKTIRYLKNHNDFLLKKMIGKYMAEYLMDYIADQNNFSYFINPIVIPVPISKKRRRKRGFNQTHLLAKYFSQNIKGDYQNNIIIKNKITKKQALINNRQERFYNVKNAFSVKTKNIKKIKGRDIIIVDDLTTTGATFGEIKKVLKKNGARNIIAISIAH